MYDNFKILNYSNSLVSPELFARHQSRLFSGNVIDGLNVVPKTGLTVTLQTGNAMIPYGSGATTSARLMSLVADFDITLDTADASNPRVDSIVIYVDTGVSLPGGTPTTANLDGPGVVKAAFVKGTPNASPVAPTVGAIQTKINAANPYFIVADVRVDTGVTTLAASKITPRSSRVATTNGLALGRASYVDTGCIWTVSSGLVGTMTSGLLYVNIAGVMVPVPLTAIASRTFTASKDTYVSVNVAGTITYNEVSNNAVSPTLPANSVWLAIVITNGSAITHVNTGQIGAIGPVLSGRILMVSDSNGELIYPTANQRLIGYAQISGGFAVTATSSALVTGLTVTLNQVAGKKLKITAWAPTQSAAGTNIYMDWEIWDGAVGTGTKIVDVSRYYTGGNITTDIQAIQHETSSSATKTYNVAARVQSGQNVAILGASNGDAFLSVELE